MLFPNHKYDRLAVILSKIRGDLSREKMGKYIGVSSTTINNWESAVSAPTFAQVMRLSSVNSLSPVKYFFDYLYPEVFWGINVNSDISLLDKAIRIIIHNLSGREKMILEYGMRKDVLVFLPHAVADLQTPIGDKQTAALAISTAYSLCDDLIDTGLDPDMRSFEKAIYHGRLAFRSDTEGYFSFNDSNADKYTSRVLALTHDLIGTNAQAIARGMRISQRTIESWRDGITTPDFNEFCELFNYSDKNIFDSFRGIFHPGINDVPCPPCIDQVLDAHIDQLSDHEKRCLFFVLYGEHKSLLYPFLQLMAEFFALPDVERRLIMIMIDNNYHNALARNCTCCQELNPYEA